MMNTVDEQLISNPLPPEQQVLARVVLADFRQPVLAVVADGFDSASTLLSFRRAVLARQTGLHPQDRRHDQSYERMQMRSGSAAEHVG